MDKLVSVIKESSLIETEVFTNWFKNFLDKNGEELTEIDFNKIKKPEEVLPMFAASLERYGEKLKQEGLEQGLEKGREQERIELAMNLIKLGSELEFVSKATGINIEELKKLKK